jgi:hypothetical protein
MASTFLSGVMGLVRSKYIAYLFGASVATDAYNAAFQLPDMIAYFLVGGTASIAFIPILSRYRESGDEAEGERALSVILTVMVCVLLVAVVLGAMFAPLYVRIFMPRFTLEEGALHANDAYYASAANILLRRRRLRFGSPGSQSVHLPGGFSPHLQRSHHSRRSPAAQVDGRFFSGGGCGRCGLPGLPDAEPLGSVPHRSAFSSLL